MTEQKKSGTSLAVIKQETIDAVEKRISALQKEGGINFPPNYSPQNALKSAWLVLLELQDREKRPVLEACSRESISNSLFYTVIQGLSPAKNQVYYIPYGKKLTAMRSYFGTMAVTKRMAGVQSITAQVIYEGDTFEYGIYDGIKKITKHEQALKNVDISKIIGAYCVITDKGGDKYVDVMSMEQIKKSWGRGEMKGNSSAHKDQPDEMAKRTVINRTCKYFVNTSDDSDLLIEAFNETAGLTEEAAVRDEITQNANAEILEIPETDYETKEEEPEPEQGEIDPGF